MLFRIIPQVPYQIFNPWIIKPLNEICWNFYMVYSTLYRLIKSMAYQNIIKLYSVVKNIGMELVWYPSSPIDILPVKLTVQTPSADVAAHAVPPLLSLHLLVPPRGQGQVHGRVLGRTGGQGGRGGLEQGRVEQGGQQLWVEGGRRHAGGGRGNFRKLSQPIEVLVTRNTIDGQGGRRGYAIIIFFWFNCIFILYQHLASRAIYNVKHLPCFIQEYAKVTNQYWQFCFWLLVKLVENARPKKMRERLVRCEEWDCR